MISPTVWVAVGLGILLFVGFYFGRDAIKGALYGRVYRIRSHVQEVKQVLRDARTLHEESQARLVALENDIRHIVSQGEDDVRVRCEMRELSFRERMRRKEEQFSDRLEAEKRQVVWRFRERLWGESLQKVRVRMEEESRAGTRDKDVMARAILCVSEVWDRGVRGEG